MIPISLVARLAVAVLFVNLSQHEKIPELKMSSEPITSHVLDTARGVPASGIQTTLFKCVNGECRKIVDKITNEDGRLSNMITPTEFTPGVYKILFDTKSYYQKLNTKTFYPWVEIVFEIQNPNEHHHIPLLLNPYGYSTYKGS